MKFLNLILGWFGGGPLQTIVDGLNKAHSDLLNSQTEQERIAAHERISTLTVALADMANARSSAKNMPWWMAIIAFGIGFPIMLHVGCIFIGTTFQPLIKGGYWDWMLRIPQAPAPFDTYEAQVIGFFFGFASVAVGTGSIARAIVQRKR